ncbi:DUF3536 domain-containing protein [Geomesophilobacter sediminis]|uniref:DUF3536 domain-containing protein n=1 Tax=Geomesophilobacter sediminis TaxID=2798584 RepID=A0A8J7M4E7_9BACT|nr:DUF3536 domain-containing protein [Geomesophilobacter sediminis]MBJ6727803.1 DUF3536 domain-containing protein [Geomesophilobacter sediminis]
MEQEKQRYLCVHGHFYQPPRENPWLESIEVQDSAHPYHDWNERITAESYAPNAASRIQDGEGRLVDIVSNYAKMSFNFGPTVLSWMAGCQPEVYRAILDADQTSIKWRGGHGAALAQVYNHIIMPLASSRDKRTQVIWGLKDFVSRYQRFPEAMWLAETAVDIESLECLAEQGIKYTILAPHQARQYRQMGSEEWLENAGETAIDPTRAYLCHLPSGRSISLFFYDGPISQALAFENLLSSGDLLTGRLLGGFSDLREGPQLVNIATDGETYGHHQKFGDMALAAAFHHIELANEARITNYGEFLAAFPAAYEVRIRERTSWSCAHGVERWNSDCGCNSGGFPGWNQAWRGPLRAALDWLRDRLAHFYERKGKEYLKDPWLARDDYIEVILDRSPENVDAFLERHATHKLSEPEIVTVLKLLELQRHTLLMYTSCGWFFDELSGVETVQVIHYAGRALQLAEGMIEKGVEEGFQERLAAAKCNYAEFRDGAYLYEKFVLRTRVDLSNVGIHYAFSSLFENYGDVTDIFSYRVEKLDYTRFLADEASIAMGRVRVTSNITRDHGSFFFCVVRIGNHDFKGGIAVEADAVHYAEMKEEILPAYDRGLYTDLIELIDKHLGSHDASLADLFTDEKRKILNEIINQNLQEFGTSYEELFEKNRPLMAYIQETGLPVPKQFLVVAQPALNAALIKKLTEEEIDLDAAQRIIGHIKSWKIGMELPDTEFAMRHHLEAQMRAFAEDPEDRKRLDRLITLLNLLREVPLDVILWQVQNDYYEMAKKVYPDFAARAKRGDEEAPAWVTGFRQLGQMLNFNLDSVLPQD